MSNQKKGSPNQQKNPQTSAFQAQANKQQVGSKRNFDSPKNLTQNMGSKNNLPPSNNHQAQKIKTQPPKQFEEDDDIEIEKDEVTLQYHKIKPVVEHVRKKSMDLVFILGTYLALDEMMI